MIYCMRTRIFFSVNNKDYLLVPNFRIIEFQSHGISRTVTDFLFFLLVPNFRIIEFSFSHTEYHGKSRKTKFDNSIIRDVKNNRDKDSSVILRDSQIGRAHV